MVFGVLGWFFSFAIFIMPIGIALATGYIVAAVAHMSFIPGITTKLQVASWRLWAIGGALGAYAATFYVSYLLSDFNGDFSNYIQALASQPLAIKNLRVPTAASATAGAGEPAEGAHYAIWVLQGIAAWIAARSGWSYGVTDG